MEKFLTIEISDKRIYGLDILRAFAILFVVIGHGAILLPKSFQFLHKVIVFDGVSLFFVLSGFLIGGILIKLLDNNKPTKALLADFWIRRWFRTLPNYFLILLVLLGFSLLYQNGITIWNTKKYFIFSQNLFYPHPDFFPEAWSLSVEEWFYLISPVCIFSLIYFLKLNSKVAVRFVAITILLAVLIFRYVKFNQIEIDSLYEWDKFFRKQVFTRLDSLMYGVLCAYIQYYAKEVWLKYKKPLLIAGLLIFAITQTLYVYDLIPIGGLYNCVFSFSVTSIATAMLLPYLSDLKSGKGFVHRGLTFISLVSYSMYLLHLSVIQFCIVNKVPWTEIFGDNHFMIVLRYATYWGMTIIGSAVVYKYFEIPTTKLRDHKKVKAALTKLLGR